MFLTLQEYLTGAQKIINLYGYNCHKCDEDCIAFVASYMMKADQTWDGISSSRDTWRFNQARYAIMKLKTKTKKQRKLVSLNKEIGSSNNRNICLSDIIMSKPTKKEIIREYNDLIKRAKAILTQKQLDCLLLYYEDGLTLQAIGDRFGVSKEAVRQNIARAIGILKDEVKS